MNIGLSTKTGGGAEPLNRDIIRQRLARPPSRRPRGDNDTARGLAGDSAVTPVDLNRYDPAKWGGLGRTLPVLPADAPRIPAAVLVPLIERGEGYAVLLTQRTTDLSAHAGQIAFPGGRAEPIDADANATALRETWEEIGLGPTHIDILGHLDPYHTVTGFEVTPVVAAVAPPFELKLDPVEVAEVFEVPLTFLLDHRNYQRHSRLLADGVTRAYHAIPFGERYIWGATAGMLLNLYEVLNAQS